MPLLYLRFYLGSLSFLFAFYLLGHYLLGFPFPTPTTLLHLALGAGAGVGLGALYHRVWPLPLLGLAGWCGFRPPPPAFMLGIGLLVLLQAQVALPYLVPLLAWLTPDYGKAPSSTP